MAKFFCSIEGLEDNYIDFSDKWTRAEVKRVESGQWADDVEFFAFIGSKSNGIHIVSEDGTEATSVDDLTDEFLDGCDARLAGFISSAPIHAARNLTSLGNWSARRWSATSETAKG